MNEDNRRLDSLGTVRVHVVEAVRRREALVRRVGVAAVVLCHRDEREVAEHWKRATAVRTVGVDDPYSLSVSALREEQRESR